MNGRSPNFNRGGGPNRFYNGTKHNHQGMKQPLHLAPNNQYLSPRGNFNVRSGSDSDQHSPDFIPIGYSSPRTAFRNSPNNSWNQDRSNNSWNQGSTTNYHHRNSFGSTISSPKSSVSSNFSPYNKFGSHRSRGGFNNSNNSNNNIPIARYCDKSMLEDPWAECEQNMIDNVEKKKTKEMGSDTEASSEECESVSNEDS